MCTRGIILARCAIRISHALRDIAVTSGSSRSSDSRGTPCRPKCARSRASSISAASSSSRATSRRRNRWPSCRANRRRSRARCPLWVSVDQEGGRVARLKRPFTEWPPMATLGRVGKPGDEKLAERFAKALAAELHAVGISLDYTPVLDVHTNPKNPVIGDRALAERAEDVARLGRGDHPHAAGRRHRRLRQAFSRARRHQHRLALRDAADRASAGSSRGRGAGAVQGGDCRGRRVDHDGAHSHPGARRRASRHAVAARSSTGC